MARLLKRNIIKLIGDGIAEVHLTKGLCALINDSDCELIAPIRWEIDERKRGAVYVRSCKREPSGRKRLHRFILGVVDPSVLVDHANGNPLDNRRCNIRICTPSQNLCNKKGGGKYSAFKGVHKSLRKDKWESSIQVNGKRVHLGSFEIETEAAIAYDDAAKLYHGEFAYLNFPTTSLHASHNHEDCAKERNVMCGNL